MLVLNKRHITHPHLILSLRIEPCVQSSTIHGTETFEDAAEFIRTGYRDGHKGTFLFHRRAGTSRIGEDVHEQIAVAVDPASRDLDLYRSVDLWGQAPADLRDLVEAWQNASIHVVILQSGGIFYQKDVGVFTGWYVGQCKS